MFLNVKVYQKETNPHGRFLSGIRMIVHSGIWAFTPLSLVFSVYLSIIYSVNTMEVMFTWLSCAGTYYSSQQDDIILCRVLACFSTC